MTADFFGEPELVPGLRYQDSVLSKTEERDMLGWLSSLPFQAFEFHGFEGKRRVVSFGWKYDFSSQRLAPVEPMPVEVGPVRRRIASLFDIEESALQQLLVTEYGPGAAIGWHKDKATFGVIVGVSLGTPCTMRFRREAGSTWERRSLELKPRSAYLLSGEARSAWEHSIPAVEQTRYSLTFRTLARGAG
jgi:alkylated DNA repair dioxygenase AlkB